MNRIGVTRGCCTLIGVNQEGGLRSLPDLGINAETATGLCKYEVALQLTGL